MDKLTRSRGSKFNRVSYHCDESMELSGDIKMKSCRLFNRHQSLKEVTYELNDQDRNKSEDIHLSEDILNDRLVTYYMCDFNILTLMPIVTFSVPSVCCHFL